MMHDRRLSVHDKTMAAATAAKDNALQSKDLAMAFVRRQSMPRNARHA